MRHLRPTSSDTVTSPEIRLLCVDDHRLLRKGVARLIDLEDDMTVVAEASNGQEAVEQFKRHTPDVTLMDLELPRMDGVEAITAIRQIRPTARIIVLTMYQGDEDIHRALSAGAATYLL
jgi:two-component system, NarL family, response regulator